MVRTSEQQKAYRLAIRNYHQRKTLCRAPYCDWGFVALDPNDIDPFTEEPRRTPCPKCDGSMFVDRQMDLFND